MRSPCMLTLPKRRAERNSTSGGASPVWYWKAAVKLSWPVLLTTMNFLGTRSYRSNSSGWCWKKHWLRSLKIKKLAQG